MKLDFCQRTFEETIKYQISRKSAPVGAKFFHEDRRTDRHDEAHSSLFVILRKAPKKRDNIDLDSVLAEIRTGCLSSTN